MNDVTEDMPDVPDPDKHFIEKITKYAPRLGDALALAATHHVKLFSTDTDWSQRIFDPSSLGKSDDGSIGVCGTTIDGDYAVTVATGGYEIGVAELGSLDLQDHVTRGNAFDLVRKGCRDVLLDYGCRPDDINDIGLLFETPVAIAPDYVDDSQKQMFFETGTDSLIVTPVVSAKVLANIEFRTRRDSETGSRVRVYRPQFGGANPQNAGAALGSTTMSTRRGKVTCFRVDPPHSEAATAQVRRIGATGSLDAGVRLPRKDLVDFMARSAIAIDLRTHLDAEARHARAITADYLTQLEGARTVVVERYSPLSEVAPFRRMDIDELAFLDPRCGEFDRIRLASRCAFAVKRAMERVTNRGDSDTEPTLLSDRSYDALRIAFEEML